jgi:hypothetical protein
MKCLGGVLLLLAAPMVTAESVERHLESHEHGKASMNVVLQGEILEVEIKTPAANILGFEHEPATDQQRQALAVAAAHLEKAEDLMLFSEGADCRLASAEVKSALLSRFEHESKHDHESEHEHESDEEGHRSHSDFELSYQFRCQKPEVLSGFSLELFQTYPLMKQLNVQSISPTGQRYQELDVDNKWVNL